MNKLQENASEIGRAIRNHQWERRAGGGIALRNGSGLFLGGALKHTHYGRHGAHSVEQAIDHNDVVNEGLNHFLNAALPPTGGYTPITAWFIAPFSGNYTPDGAVLTANNFTATATEFTAYTSATRLPLTIATAATAQTTGNSGNEAVMTLNSGGPYNIYGAVIIGASAKSSQASKLLAAIRFATPRLNMAGGDRLGLEYVITAADDV